MATQTEQPVQTTPPLYRFTVEKYHRMIEAGILGDDDRVELIAGEVVRMAAMGSKHAGCIQRLTRLLPTRLGEREHLRVQLPVTVPDYDEPEPDLAVVRARPDDYDQGHPTPSDALLLIEVADTSLAYDRGMKLPTYARAGFPETWLVDLVGSGIEQHTDPDRETGAYRSVRRFGHGETISSSVLPGLALSVDSVLGGATSAPSSSGNGPNV